MYKRQTDFTAAETYIGGIETVSYTHLDVYKRQFMMSVFQKKSMAFIFSDFEDSYDLKILRVASKKHQLLGMRVFDDKDNEIPDIGYALFHDAETGKQVWANTSNSRWRYNYAEHQKKKIKAVSYTHLDVYKRQEFSRIQFTPDLLPADVVGTMMYNIKDNDFSIKRGPIFANFVLADEINRAPSKVQSALLEAMQEKQVTIGDETMPLPKPFLVLATQNPIDQEGTYLLPEAQSDRFMLKCTISYPDFEDERKIMQMVATSHQPVIKPVISLQNVIEAKELINQIYLDEKIEKYILDMVFATRYPEKYGLSDLKNYISFGASPRASINLAIAARALACLLYTSRCV